MRKVVIKILDRISLVMGSKFGIVIAILPFVIGSLWVAIFFRSPLLYDEQFHLDAIKTFSGIWTPIVYNQAPQYDVLGNVTFGSVSIYHYLLGKIYLIASIFTQNNAALVTMLRLINVGLATLGLVLFYKLFNELGVKRKYSNSAIFLYANLPIATVVAATINYDNLMFPLTAIFLIYAARLARGHLNWQNWCGMVLSGLIASLNKFTFLPILTGAAMFIIIDMQKLGFRDSYRRTRNSFVIGQKYILGAMLLLILFFFCLFFVRYGISMAKYHTPIPSCEKTMPLRRCLANPVVAIEQKIKSTAEQRPITDPYSYVQNWFFLMSKGYAVTSVNSTKGQKGAVSPPVYYYLHGVGIVLLSLFTIYSWRALKKDRSWYLLLTVLFFLVLSTLFFNMMSYYNYHQNINMQPRYMLPILPILFLFGVISIAFSFRKYNFLKLLIILIVIFVNIQGGGFVTHSLQTDSTWYWQNEPTLIINQKTKEWLGPIVIDEANPTL